MSKIGETTLEINLSSLTHNFNFLKSKLDSKTKFLAVLKAFAYGSDMIAIAEKLESLQVDYFAVAYVKEGVILRDAGIKSPILVLHPQSVNFKELIDRNLEPSLYSNRVLNDFLSIAKAKKQSNYPIHLKFNTGLNRLGFKENDVTPIIKKIEGEIAIKVASVFSHLAASEDKNEEKFSIQQIKKFEQISLKITEKLGYTPIRHILNTSGILNYPKAQFDMVRSGIGLYGYGNSIEIVKQLKPIASLISVISQIHKIDPDESVGYNRAFKSNGARVCATLPIGHADGISRQYGNGKTYVLVNGKKAPIIGNVCMDMIMIDITGIACEEGDKVVLFGEEVSAESFANTAQTISYELLTAISQRVKRNIKN